MRTRINTGSIQHTPQACLNHFNTKIAGHFAQQSNVNRNNSTQDKLLDLVSAVYQKHKDFRSVSIPKFSMDLRAKIRVAYKDEPQTKANLISVIERLFPNQRVIVVCSNQQNRGHQRSMSTPNPSRPVEVVTVHHRSSDPSNLRRTTTEKSSNAALPLVQTHQDESGEESKEDFKTCKTRTYQRVALQHGGPSTNQDRIQRQFTNKMNKALSSPMNKSKS